jgi:hypothetical protein
MLEVSLLGNQRRESIALFALPLLQLRRKRGNVLWQLWRTLMETSYRQPRMHWRNMTVLHKLIVSGEFEQYLMASTGSFRRILWFMAVVVRLHQKGYPEREVSVLV